MNYWVQFGDFVVTHSACDKPYIVTHMLDNIGYFSGKAKLTYWQEFPSVDESIFIGMARFLVVYPVFVSGTSISRV